MGKDQSRRRLSPTSQSLSSDRETLCLTKWYRVTPDIDSQDRQCESECREEATSSCRWAPETIKDGVQKIPLIPVGLPKFALHCSRGADAEEEDQCLAGEYRRRLTPACIAGSFRVTSQVRLLIASVSKQVQTLMLNHVYIDQESGCHTQAAIDAVEHTPSKSAPVDAIFSQAVDTETTAVIDAPSKHAQTCHRTDERFNLHR